MNGKPYVNQHSSIGRVKRVYIVGLIWLMFCPGGVMASESIPAGKIESLSYRGGYVMFKVVGDNGVNFCAACPVDPGKMGKKRCWIDESKQAQLSMLLMAKAQNLKIAGRVSNFATNCNVYQMTVVD